MVTPAVQEIESQFARLSPEDQLGLLERLTQRARHADPRPASWEAGLAAMAADPQIRRELESINAEFGPAEADGLERH